MKCQHCGKEYQRKPKDTCSKYCPACRPAVHLERCRTYHLRREKRHIQHIDALLEYEKWKRDFSLGKTVSNL